MQGIQQTVDLSGRRPYPVRARVVAIVIAAFAAGILVGRVATIAIQPGAIVPGTTAQASAAAEQRSLIEFRAGERAGASSTVAAPASSGAEQRSLIEFRAGERAGASSTVAAPPAP